MKKVLKKSAIILGAALMSTAGVGVSVAGVISGWDTSNVVTDPGPYTDASTYYSTIYNTDGSSNGVISWKHGDVQPPGLKVINIDDVDGSNCLMTTGYNPYDLSDKQCTDPLQSSKRFKLRSTLNAPLDVTYDVAAGATSIYRVLQKWTDGTDLPWSAFTIELGSMVSGEFIPSTVGDGLGFSDTRGKYFVSTTSYQNKEDTLSALFADGLAGPVDKYHPEPGYFNVDTRMAFGLLAIEDKIISDGVSASYSDVFGEWINASAVPIAVFYDDDGDLGTDNILMANCAEPGNLIRTGSHTGDDVIGFTCDGQWVTFRAAAGLDGSGVPYTPDGVPKPLSLTDLASTVHTSIEEAAASSDAYPFYMDYIEDAANLGFNMWITVDESFAGSSFTVRYTPIPSDGTIPPPVEEETICEDGLDNDNDGLTDCADSDCAGIAFCGTEGRQETCSDGYDNDGDGDIDCTDSGCANNRSCR
jgi:hypothetical protein